jgi:tripartite-type tricarboxylate transporter receptor subunit TctC
MSVLEVRRISLPAGRERCTHCNGGRRAGGVLTSPIDGEEMHVNRAISRAAALGALAAASLTGPLCAQGYPAKPIRMISMHTGVADSYSRLLAAKISESMGQTLVVDPMLGAGGAIAAEAVARAAPDGYTVLAAFPDAIVLRHLLVRKMTYDAVKDFTPITQLVEPIIVLAASPSLPPTMKEVIDLARANPGKLSYGSLGIGSSFQLAGEAVKQLARVDIIHVPFKSPTDSIVAMARGDLSMVYTAQGVALPHHQAGKLRIVGTVNDRRAAALPDVPSIREVVPGFESPPFWAGYLGPANLPRPLLQRLNAEFVRAGTQPDIRQRATEIGFATVASSAEEFRIKIRDDIEKSNRIGREAGIQPE